MNKEFKNNEYFFYENLRKIQAQSEYMSYDAVLSISAATGYLKNLINTFNPYHFIQYLGAFNALITTPLPISLIVGSACVFLGNLYYYLKLKSKILPKNLLDTFKYDFQSINYTNESLSETHLTLFIRRNKNWFNILLSDLFQNFENGVYEHAQESFDIYKKIKKYYKPPFYLSLLGRETFSFSIEDYFHFLKMAAQYNNQEALSEISEDLIEHLLDAITKNQENNSELNRIINEFQVQVCDLPNTPILSTVRKLLLNINIKTQLIRDSIQKESILDEVKINSSLQKIKIVAKIQDIVTLNLIDPIMSLNNKVYNLLGLLQPSSLILLIKYNAPLISSGVMFLSAGFIYVTQFFCASYLKKSLDDTKLLDLFLFAKKKEDPLSLRLLFQKIHTMSALDWSKFNSELNIKNESNQDIDTTLSLRGQLAEDYILLKLTLVYPKIEYSKLRISYFVSMFDKLFFIKYFSPASYCKPNSVIINYIQKFTNEPLQIEKLEKLVKRLSKRTWHDYLTDTDKNELKSIAYGKSEKVKLLINQLINKDLMRTYQENTIILRKLKRNTHSLKLLDDFLFPFNTIVSTLSSSFYFFIPAMAVTAAMMYTIIPAITFIAIFASILISKLILNSYYKKNLSKISLENILDCFINFPLDLDEAKILNQKILATSPKDWGKFIELLNNKEFIENLTTDKIQILKSIVLNYSSNHIDIDFSETISQIDDIEKKMITSSFHPENEVNNSDHFDLSAQNSTANNNTIENSSLEDPKNLLFLAPSPESTTKSPSFKNRKDT